MVMKDSTVTSALERPSMFLFKGDPTTRKTANAGGFGEPGEPMAIMDVDGKCGSISVAHPGKKFSWDIYGGGEFRRFDDDFTAFCDKPPCEGGTFIMDSVTSIVKMVLYHTLGAKGGGRKNKQESIGDITLPNWDDYNAETVILDDMMAGLKQMSKKCRVILIAHVTGTGEMKSEGKNIVFRKLFTAGKGPAVYIPSQFREIYHFYLQVSPDPTAPPQYVCRTQNSSVDYASTQLPIPAEIDVTKGDLYQKLKSYCEPKGIKI